MGGGLGVCMVLPLSLWTAAELYPKRCCYDWWLSWQEVLLAGPIAPPLAIASSRKRWQPQTRHDLLLLLLLGLPAAAQSMGAAAAAARGLCTWLQLGLLLLLLLLLMLLDDAWAATKRGEAKRPMTGQNSKVVRGL